MSFEGPEIEAHRPHGHGGLPRWLEMLLSLSALIVSISSIAIALHHGEIMEKLVEANSLPYLDVATGNETPDGRFVLSVKAYNHGIGPADEQSLTLKVDGRYVTSMRELRQAVFAPAEQAAAGKALQVYSSNAHTRFVPARDEALVFTVARTPENAPYWDQLDQSRRRWEIDYCYCSVFHECWAVHREDRRKVKACHRDETHEFRP